MVRAALLVMVVGCVPPQPTPVGAQYPGYSPQQQQPYAQPTPVTEPAPAVVQAQPAVGAIDIAARAPNGFTEKRAADHVRWTMHVDRGQFTAPLDYELVVLPSIPRPAALDDAFRQFTADMIKANGFQVHQYVVTPQKRRLASKYALVFDETDAQKPDLQGKVTHGGSYRFVTYYLVGKTRVVPLVGYYQGHWAGPDVDLDRMMEPWFDALAIANDSPDDRPLVDRAALVGRWRGGNATLANYVDQRGNVVGNASLYAASFYQLEADGSAVFSFAAAGQGKQVASVQKGTWTVEDDMLVLTLNGKRDATRIWSDGLAPNGSRAFRVAPTDVPGAKVSVVGPRSMIHIGYVYPQ